jgi:hypothetical protein
MKSKRGMEFGFNWMFAIIVGATILAFSIYVATKYVSTERDITDTESAKELSVLLNPVETSLESGKVIKIKMPQETRIYNDCETQGKFGIQSLRIATESKVGKEWQEPGNPIEANSKYLFSDDVIEGKEFLVFSKPFNFPFKVADIIIMFDANEKYCFIATPDEVKEELSSLFDNKTIEFKLRNSECAENSKKVCFDNSKCDINVNINTQSIIKDKTIMYYTGPLLYAGIFSNKYLYECQINRLMKRTGEISTLLLAKSQLLTSKNCNSGIVQGSLNQFANAVVSVKTSADLKRIQTLSEELEGKNEMLSCKIF